MDRVIDTVEILRREVAFYHGDTYRATTYHVEDREKDIYTVVVVPDADYPLPAKAGVMVLARIVDGRIRIEVDNTDHPLYERLVNSGIPMEQIDCAYAT